MKRLGIVLFMAIGLSAFAADTPVKGFLVDLACAKEDGQKADFGAKHSKDCLQMPDCDKSGFAVLTDDKKVIRFDKAGNDQARKFISTLKDGQKNIKVTVTGSVKGDQMTVNKIELQ